MKKTVDVYLYGMVLLSTSFLMKEEYPLPDSYGEYKRKVQTCGGETGTCAMILSNLGSNVLMDGNHLGTETYPKLKVIFDELNIDISPMTVDHHYAGLEDFVLTCKDSRTCIGTFQDFYSDPENGRWNMPNIEDIQRAKVVGLDPFFFKETEEAVKICKSLKTPYVTIDCHYDSIIHKESAINIVSNEFLKREYKGEAVMSLFKAYQESSNGLTIFTFGESELMYGRKGSEINYFKPYSLDVVSTLGAGDSFKAGAIYALSKSYSDEKLVAFASATAGLALTHYPMFERPPILEDILNLVRERS